MFGSLTLLRRQRHQPAIAPDAALQKARGRQQRAPLVVDLAQQRGDGGVQEHLGWFFKLPMTRDGAQPEHALHRQEQVLLDWLAAGSGDPVDPYPADSTADGRVEQTRLGKVRLGRR